jgi:hypothetical protein
MSDESALLNRISVARGNAEPEQGPTAEPEAVDVSQEMPAEEVGEETAEPMEEAVTDSTINAEEEEVEEVQESEELDDGGDLYVEYKGREINLKDVYETEQGQLRQSDYTRKTQAHAKDVDEFKVEREAFNKEKADFQSNIAEVNAIIAEETLTPEALQEMRDYEPEEYIKYQEKVAKRKDVLGRAKAAQPNNDADVAAEGKKLFDSNPSWVKDGKTTDAFTNDTALMKAYALDIGFTGQEFDSLSRAHHMQVILDAAKFRKMSKSNASVEKKVRKAPVTTKPRAAIKSSVVTQLEKAQARLKQTGSADDAVNVRRLKRQLQE